MHLANGALYDVLLGVGIHAVPVKPVEDSLICAYKSWVTTEFCVTLKDCVLNQNSWHHQDLFWVPQWCVQQSHQCTAVIDGIIV